MLDKYYYEQKAGAWLIEKNENLSFSGVIKTKKKRDEDSVFTNFVNTFIDFFNNPSPLGRQPDDLSDVLTKMALASPIKRKES